MATLDKGQILSDEAVKSVRKYLKSEFRSRLITSMVNAAFTIDGCADDEKHREFHSGLVDYRLTIAKLIPDAVIKFLEIVLACPHILNGEAPHEFLKSHVKRELIEPATRMTHAWLYWVLKGHLAGYNLIPMGVDEFSQYPLALPEWWFFGPDDPNRQLPGLANGLINSEQGQTRIQLGFVLEDELNQANITINIARLKVQKDGTGSGWPAERSGGVSKAQEFMICAGQLYLEVVEHRGRTTRKIDDSALLGIAKKLEESGHKLMDHIPEASHKAIAAYNSKNGRRPDQQIKDWSDAIRCNKRIEGNLVPRRIVIRTLSEAARSQKRKNLR